MRKLSLWLFPLEVSGALVHTDASAGWRNPTWPARARSDLAVMLEKATPDFEVLVERYYRRLYQFALSLCGTEAEARDLTQQTFYVWARKGHQLRDTAK